MQDLTGGKGEGLLRAAVTIWGKEETDVPSWDTEGTRLTQLWSRKEAWQPPTTSLMSQVRHWRIRAVRWAGQDHTARPIPWPAWLRFVLALWTCCSPNKQRFRDGKLGTHTRNSKSERGFDLRRKYTEGARGRQNWKGSTGICFWKTLMRRPRSGSYFHVGDRELLRVLEQSSDSKLAIFCPQAHVRTSDWERGKTFRVPGKSPPWFFIFSLWKLQKLLHNIILLQKILHNFFSFFSNRKAMHAYLWTSNFTKNQNGSYELLS